MIQVVERTFDLLELLARENAPLSNSEIAARMKLNLQTANNLLRTLYRRGYVTQDDDRSYRLGAQCFYLGSFADRWAPLRRMAAEPLRQLVRNSGFGGFVGVIDHDRLLGVALLPRGESELVPPPQNWWEELHSTACGRVLLAGLPPERRARLFARTLRRKCTGKTVVEAAELERLCLRTAHDRCAEVRDESRTGVSSLAVPLHDLGGGVIAALALHGPDAEWDRVPLETKLEHLARATRQLEFR